MKLYDAQGHEQLYTEPEGNPARAEIVMADDVPPHIVKIPLRAEYRALLDAAAAYEAHASRLLKLAWEAKEQAQNLKQIANL